MLEWGQVKAPTLKTMTKCENLHVHVSVCVCVCCARKFGCSLALDFRHYDEAVLIQHKGVIGTISQDGLISPVLKCLFPPRSHVLARAQYFCPYSE